MYTIMRDMNIMIDGFDSLIIQDLTTFRILGGAEPSNSDMKVIKAHN